MNEILKWIKKNWIRVTLTSILVLFSPIVIVHILYKIPAPLPWLVSNWGAGDVLNYLGSALSFLGTIFLGGIAIYQSQTSNQMNKDLLELELKRQQPCISVVTQQAAYIELEDVDEENESSLDLLIKPLFILEPRTGIVKNVALMRMTIANSGSSDIVTFYLKDMKYYISTNQPKLQQMPIGIIGDTYLERGQKKRLYIRFQQELDPSNEDVDGQISWIKERKHLITPHIEFLFGITSSDGYSYCEKLTINSDGGSGNEDQAEELRRQLHVHELKVYLEHTDIV